jgi:hypothetical protein
LLERNDDDLLEDYMLAFEVSGEGKSEFPLLFLSCADHVAQIDNHAAYRALRFDDSIVFFDCDDRSRRRHKGIGSPKVVWGCRMALEIVPSP